MAIGRESQPTTMPASAGSLSGAGRVTESIEVTSRIAHLRDQEGKDEQGLPDPAVVLAALDKLLALIFPGFVHREFFSSRPLKDAVNQLIQELAPLLIAQVELARGYRRYAQAHDHVSRHVNEEGEARRIVQQFIHDLPSVRRAISLDVQAAFDGDPAAIHTDEIVLCYPGITALAVHRLAHELHHHGVPIIPRIMAEHAHARTGIDIHPGARIGESMFIDHGTGVVIGETSIIGDHCRIYQGVTLGAKSFEKDNAGKLVRGSKRHPTLEDHVTVYANATILGGDTVIGAGSVINGGAFVTTSIPPGHVVRGPKPDITLRSNPELPPPNFDI